ncbi:hypothetical protein SeLEV6574_g04356 [Synchytrium endobioticum]|nr:hypothetical protein SeLEV6574_g04356 [Synchytrium endobioticum]
MATAQSGIKRVIPWTFELNVKTPQLQNRQMQKIILNNRLSALLISDPSTPHVGAALSVEAGSWSDGKSEGTAHFLEHMLFLGTVKYPKENDYERFIYDHNGVLNAYTSSDHTMYYFTNVTPNAFEGALDRFSRFFYEPLFNDSCVEREQNAVDEEFRKNIEQDGWRLLHLRKELALQSHPFAQFNTGNLETMKLIDQSYLKNWYRKMYSANVMNLVVMGKDPIERLQELVCKYFAPVPDHGVAPLVTNGSKVFPKSLEGSLVAVEPMKDLKEMTLSWEIPFEFADLDTKPGRLTGLVLGHEGQGSLLSLLKRERLAEGLSASKSEIGAQNLLFEVSVTLTEAGVADYKTVIHRIFEAIARAQSQPYPEYLASESNAMSKIAYEFQQRSAGIVAGLCRSIRKEGIETFPSKSTLIRWFDASAVHRLFASLKPHNCVVYLISKNLESNGLFKLNQKEKWMGARYGVSRLTDDDMRSWCNAQPHPEITYPERNRFIPDNLALVGDVKNSLKQNPVLISASAEGRLYFHLDDTFYVPECLLSFAIKTPAIRPNNPKSLALAELYIRFVHERLNELSYDATSAGLHYDVYVKDGTGIGLSVDGYSQKAIMLLTQVLARLKNPTPTFKEFQIFKESLTRSYRNMAKESPLRQASETLSSIIYRQFSTSKDIGDAMDTITFEELLHFVNNHIYKKRIIEGYVGGNMTRNDAVKAYELLQGELPGAACQPEEVSKSEVVHLNSNTGTQKPLLYQTFLDVKGNAVIWVCDAGIKTDLVARTGQELLGKLMREPFYSELRTKQQTGYIVSSGTFVANKRLFMQAAVQSNTYDARDLLSRIELFMEGFARNELIDAAPADSILQRFDSIKSASLIRLKQPHDTLSSRERYLAYCCYEEDATFDIIERRITTMEEFGLNDLKDFCYSVLDWKKNKGRLAVITTGNDPGNRSLSYVSFSDVEELRSKL